MDLRIGSFISWYIGKFKSLLEGHWIYSHTKCRDVFDNSGFNPIRS